MLKIRPLFMILTGVGLAALLWVIVLGGQGRTENTLPPHTGEENITDLVPEAHVISPASILSVKQDGDTFMVTGVSMAGAEISLYANDQMVGQVKSDGGGHWLFEFSEADAKTAYLEIHMVTPDGQQIRSSQAIFIVDAGFEDIPRPEKLILLTGPGTPSRVLQTPFGDMPSIDDFTLEVIDYDNSGGVIFSGSSLRPGKVRIYANNNLVGESSVDNTGRWSLIFGNIMPLGAYDISAELVSEPDGASTRLKLPFSRMEPLLESENSPEIVVERFEDNIQIGRVLFGGGYQYSVVYGSDALVVE